MSSGSWELRVTRHAIHRNGSLVRTYSDYQVYRDGQLVPALTGNMCESRGPSDNDHRGSGRRVEEGVYPLWTQFGRYRTVGYGTQGTELASKMPALLLRGTGRRDGILIHPGHPPTLFLSSVGCLNPTGALSSSELMNFTESRARVIAIIDDLKDFYPDAFERETTTKIGNARVTITGEPEEHEIDPIAAAFASPQHSSEPQSLPISRQSAIKCAQWLVAHFGGELKQAVRGKPYGVKHLCAIVCQETAYKWLGWVNRLSPEKILARCVFDASGDYPGTTRSAFPRTTAEFRTRFGNQFCDMLIEEANITRRLQNYGDQSWVYKGYGIFQYDLQHVVADTDFFREKQWTSFDTCLSKCCTELDDKLVISRGDLWKAIRMYNGSGPRAEQYMRNVMAFTDYCETALEN